ncbi:MULTISPECIES: hypothetical protein [unclassified Pseudomonas]|nr:MULTISPECIES: hypothetical protein [unclassified Pseudomonas]
MQDLYSLNPNCGSELARDGDRPVNIASEVMAQGPLAHWVIMATFPMTD